MSPVLVAVAAGVLIGLSLGALGGGGSVLAVPVLAYGLDQSAAQATTGALVVVGLSAAVGAVTAHRAGTVLLGRGLAFGAVAIGGAVVGARAAVHVPGEVLLASFSVLMLVVGGLMARHAWRSPDDDPEREPDPEPILRFRPDFACRCPRALKVLVAATAVGLLTGFLGVGGGFLVVPALVLALGIPLRYAAGTSLVVIAVTSAVALGVRFGEGAQPDWTLVALLTASSVLASFAGARLARRVDARRLAQGFAALVVAVAVGTAAVALPALA